MTVMLWSKRVRSTAINYLDTSVLYEFYVRGSRTTEIRDFVKEQQKNLAISSWVEVEFYGVLGRRMRDGTIPANAASAFAYRYTEHVSRGLFKRFAVKEVSMNQASALVRRFTLGVKSADALHLGLVQAESLTLVTSDAALAAVATALGLETNLIE
jgi:predicted nucleic acid-binding protein